MFSYNNHLQKHHFLDVLNTVMLPLVAVRIETEFIMKNIIINKRINKDICWKKY